MAKVLQHITRKSDFKVIFCDFFDTLVHRTVHPNYVFKLWAKLLIRELGLSIGIDELYGIRASSIDFLCKRENLRKPEIPYETVISEIYQRLVTSEIIQDIPYDRFNHYFEEADYYAEISVQFINKKMIAELEVLIEKEYPIYLVSDFHLPKRTIKRMIDFHGMSPLFTDVYISSTCVKSKERGNIYPYVLADTKSNAQNTLMIGDNKKSDVQNAQKHGIHALYLDHFLHKFRNKRNLFGSAKKPFNTVFKETELRCNKSKHPFSEYIIHYYSFIERLYIKARENNIKNLFFLAREGLYLKQLFDVYQEMNQLVEGDNIKTHYLKISRHSAMQLAFKPIEQEEFKHIRKSYGKMSLKQFLDSFLFPKQVVEAIIADIDIKDDEIIPNFVGSEVMQRLRKNQYFIEHYDRNRNNQNKRFKKYLNSFNVDFKKEGMVMTDIGWGGTMQECIYQFLKKDIKVTGYYLGLRSIYNIESATKRFGLNFSVHPSTGFSDYVLMANTQIYEQMLAAPHGSTLGYTNDTKSPTIEFHEAYEAKIFKDYISPIQRFMLGEFKLLIQNLKPISYSQPMVQEYITDMAMRIGLFTNREKLKFINQISKGFYQNIGNNKVGLDYDPNQIEIPRLQLLKQFLWSPEKTFRYLVKVKPMFYSRGNPWLGWPVNLAYYYIILNRRFKRNIFKKELLK